MTDESRWAPEDIGDGTGAFDHFFDTELLTRFRSSELRRRSDAARLAPRSQATAVTCDAFTVDPIFFPGGDIGSLAFCGTANDLLTEAARPEQLMLSLIVSQHLEHAELRRVLDSLAALADAAGAEVIGGDTKTIPTREPRMIVTITGIGLARRQGPALGFSSVRAGDEIVVTGAVGAHAIAVLSAREGLGFDQVVTSDVQDVGRVLGAFVATDPHLRALRDASRGGVLGVLHEIVADTGLDLEVDVAAITVQREVAMAAEMLGLDPLELANEGCFVLLIEQGQAAAVVSQLRGEYGMSDAVHAGTVRSAAEPPGRLVLQTETGRKLSLRSRRVGVPRLC